jgi:threonylcarbamoyladenosine tRNA methylthiotransferase MtaB
MKAVFFTLGCKLNQSESEALANSFGGRGFSLLPPTTRARADIFVVNSCTVTTKAEQKARRMIRAFARENPASAVLVTGCYAQLDPEELRSLEENVVVLPLDAKASILDLPEYLEKAVGEGYTPLEAVRSFAAEKSSSADSGDLETRDRFRFTGASRSRAFLKIQDGCDNSCAYCRVHLARGASVSLDSASVIERALSLQEEGYGEIVLTGVNLTAWREPGGAEEGPGPNGLPRLLKALHEALSFSRIRLSSLETDMIDSALLAALALPRIRPHFHLPVQSGSDRILASVGRKYSAREVLAAVRELKAVKEDPFLAADIIVGLPGEGEEDFMATLELVQACGFAHVHAFPFSPRPGTPLFDAPGKVPQRITGERLEQLNQLSTALHRNYLSRRTGEEAEAILERRLDKDTCMVLTDRYLHLPCYGVPENSPRGSLLLVTLEEESASLCAKYINKVK